MSFWLRVLERCVFSRTSVRKRRLYVWAAE